MIKKILYIACAILLIPMGCTEPYPLDSEGNFEEYLVVEARITNQEKFHEIKITTTYPLGQDEAGAVTDATVYVEDSAGNSYPFQYDSGDKVYRSTQQFQAVPDLTYRLHISHAGNDYVSSEENLTAVNPIENLEVQRNTVQGVDGVQVLVNSYDPTNSSVYYRYEYEETYKVRAPYYSDIKAVVLGPQDISYETTNEYKETCYATDESTALILHNTSAYAEDRVQDFPVRFIPVNNGIIAYRYSIKVTQFVESYAAYSFYETLKELSQEGSVLSPNQPGFISGNISGANDPDDKVIGFFEVVSESSERIFFNFLDVFPDASAPPYIFDCSVSELNSIGFTPPDDMDGFSLTDIIQTNTLILYSVNGTLFTMVSPECGDCSTFADPEAPDFWEE